MEFFRKYPDEVPEGVNNPDELEEWLKIYNVVLIRPEKERYRECYFFITLDGPKNKHVRVDCREGRSHFRTIWDAMVFVNNRTLGVWIKK